MRRASWPVPRSPRSSWESVVRGMCMPRLVAAITWLKAWLVAYFFLEAKLCHTFIRRLIWVFIAFAPIALTLTDMFGPQFAAAIQI